MYVEPIRLLPASFGRGCRNPGKAAAVFVHLPKSDFCRLTEVYRLLGRAATDYANVPCVFSQFTDCFHIPQAGDVTQMLFVVRMKIG